MRNQRPVSEILASKTPNIKRLMEYSKHLKTLQKRVTGLLPTPLSLHCTVANHEGATLVLMSDSPAWATKLRLMSPKLIRALSNAGVEHIEIKIAPKNEPKARPRRHAAMSHSTSNLLNDMANSIDDPKLSAALRRLARHGADAE